MSLSSAPCHPRVSIFQNRNLYVLWLLCMHCPHASSNTYNILLPSVKAEVYLFLLAAFTKTFQNMAVPSGLVSSVCPSRSIFYTLQPAPTSRSECHGLALIPQILNCVVFFHQTLTFVNSLLKKVVPLNSQYESDTCFLLGPWQITLPSSTYLQDVFMALSPHLPYQSLLWINSYFPLWLYIPNLTKVSWGQEICTTLLHMLDYPPHHLLF